MQVSSVVSLTEVYNVTNTLASGTNILDKNLSALLIAAFGRG